MGSWIDRILGRDYPGPAVGQVWRCGHNGELMKVVRVHVHVTGTVFVDCADENTEWGRRMPQWGIGYPYAMGLRDWRTKLRQERRVLCTEPGQEGATT